MKKIFRIKKLMSSIDEQLDLAEKIRNTIMLDYIGLNKEKPVNLQTEMDLMAENVTLLWLRVQEIIKQRKQIQSICPHETTHIGNRSICKYCRAISNALQN